MASAPPPLAPWEDVTGWTWGCILVGMFHDVALGAGIGALMSLLSWNGNRLRGVDGVSLFPDLLSLLALPLLVYAAIALLGRQPATREAGTLRAAGSRMVLTASIVYTVAVTALGLLRSTDPSWSAVIIVMVLSFSLTLLLGLAFARLSIQRVISRRGVASPPG